MSRMLSQFLERLADRLTVLVAGVVSSQVESFNARRLAEQQSELEELARRLDAEGKPEIAQGLRQRQLGLASADLAGRAEESIRLLSLGSDRPDEQMRPDSVTQLPDFSGRRRHGKRSAVDTNLSSESRDESESGETQ